MVVHFGIRRTRKGAGDWLGVRSHVENFPQRSSSKARSNSITLPRQATEAKWLHDCPGLTYPSHSSWWGKPLELWVPEQESNTKSVGLRRSAVAVSRV